MRSSDAMAVRRPTHRRQLAVLLVTALTSASGLLWHPGTAQASTPAESAAATSVMRMLNAERVANHVPILGWSTALVSSAHRHNLSMANADVLSHQLPGEPVFSTRISQAGVLWHSAAENIAWTTDRTSAGADGLESRMYGERSPEDGHRRNILSTSVRFVGIDVVIDGPTGKLWLTEDFADVIGPVPASTAGHNPIGYYDSAVAVSGHRIRVRGWALDPDNRSLPLSIAVYYDQGSQGRTEPGLRHYGRGAGRPAFGMHVRHQHRSWHRQPEARLPHRHRLIPLAGRSRGPAEPADPVHPAAGRWPPPSPKYGRRRLG